MRNQLDRLLATLEGEPKVVGFHRDGNVIRLRMSFRGYDDDAFEIEADTRTIRFDYPDASE